MLPSYKILVKAREIRDEKKVEEFEEVWAEVEVLEGRNAIIKEPPPF
jgi:hypothetical protein